MPEEPSEETVLPGAGPAPSRFAEAVRAAAPVGAGAELAARLAERVEAEACRPAAPAPTYPAALLERLREEVVAGWLRGGAPPSPAEAAAVLRAFDRVREELLSPGGEDAPLRVVAEFAHDLRSPLTSILFLAGALREGQGGAPLSEPHRRQVGIIYSAALGLVSMAGDMIELYRGGPGAPADVSPLLVEGMFDSLGDVLAPLAEEKRVELRLRPAPGDPRLGNAVALSRVLLNLAVNALQCTDEGWVEISAEPAGAGRLRFSVRDTGRGIDPSALDPATGHFRRHGSGYGFSGTGLGLGICRKLVGEMGGELSVQSTLGEGTHAWFTLDLPTVPREG